VLALLRRLSLPFRDRDFPLDLLFVHRRGFLPFGARAVYFCEKIPARSFLLPLLLSYGIIWLEDPVYLLPPAALSCTASVTIQNLALCDARLVA